MAIGFAPATPAPAPDFKAAFDNFMHATRLMLDAYHADKSAPAALPAPVQKMLMGFAPAAAN